jgi:hypothetical protein
MWLTPRWKRVLLHIIIVLLIIAIPLLLGWLGFGPSLHSAYIA